VNLLPQHTALQPFAPYEAARGEYVISTDPARLDAVAIHAYLTRSYWASGRTLEAVTRSLHYSLCFGLYHSGRQVGLARVITDWTTYAYLCDVYVLEEHRGRGLGKWLVESVLAHPELQTVRRWTLITSDAHGLYAGYGFTPQANPDRHMELIRKPAPSATVPPSS